MGEIKMDTKTKNILDQLFADKISIGEAVEALNMSIEDVFKLADDYEYIPSLEEIREANEIVREGYEHIRKSSKNES